ncbi:uncharacterized protein LOC119685913 [Teleopsis dalmanni]|uniref:uncharacterized protein LOC119685913 n=1 Tax=Teleopsis dalmanni TaxID=139649 RepID=UPI0018CE76ED|nr:uncharacterized protein LOC119685913 [Teleopsis dalmanni]
MFYIIKTAPRNFGLLWTKANCSVTDPYYVAEFSCEIIPLPKEKSNYLDPAIRFSRDIKQLVLDFRIVMERGNQKNFELLKFKADGCNILNKQAKNPIMNAMFKRVFQASNFPSRCPIKGNITYKTDKFAIDPESFPMYTPEMNFTTKLYFYSEKKTLMATGSMDTAVFNKGAN